MNIKFQEKPLHTRFQYDESNEEEEESYMKTQRDIIQ